MSYKNLSLSKKRQTAMKKLKFMLLLILGNLHSIINAQVSLEWAKSIGGEGTDEGIAIAIDENGNIYSTGTFESTVDFDPSDNVLNLTSGGAYDIFITKLNTDGNLIWSKRIGGSEYDTGISISIDNNDDVIVSGRFNGTVDFDPGVAIYNLTSDELSDVFICKLNSSGDFLWAKQISGIDQYSFATSTSLTFDQFDNIYSTGYFFGAADFDPGSSNYNLTATGQTDSFILKLNSAGDFIWVKQFACINYWNRVKSYCIVVDAEQNVYTTGEFEGLIDFDPGIDTVFYYISGKMFVTKLNANGDFEWTKIIRNDQGYFNITSLFVDSNKDIYTTGSFSRTADFDPSDFGEYLFTTTTSNSDIFISKLDSLGNFVWAKRLGSTGDDQSNSLFVDLNGNVYTTGYFAGETDFDPNDEIYNLESVGYDDIFISKLDNLGNFVAAHQLGGSFYEQGKAILVDENNTIYTTGFFHETVDFDPSEGVFNLMSGGFSDIYIHKMNQDVVDLNEYVSNSFFSINPNPSSTEITIGYSLNGLQNISFSIYDIRGRLIKKIEKGNKPAGKYVLEKVDISKLATGIYFVQMQTDKESIVKKLVKD
jgi:Secretion system C-terminal sorting domain/Beta-propeller repeat